MVSTSILARGLVIALAMGSITVSADILNFTIPGSLQAAGASNIVDATFPAFGIEFSNVISFTGTASHPNALSKRLLQNIADYTGAGPAIRVGGNTQDNAIYSSTQKSEFLVSNPNAKGVGVAPADFWTYGDKLFTAINNGWPSSVQITYGLNLAWNNPSYLTDIVDTASAARKNLGSRLVSFEIGNEPDLYGQNGFRTGSPWTGEIYTKEFLQRANAVQANVLQPNGLDAAFFQAGCPASSIGNDWNVKALSDYGVNGGGLIQAYNQHDYFFYISVSTYSLDLQMLMDHNLVKGQFNYWSKQVQVALDLGRPYVLGEMAPVGPAGIAGITDVFGAALWCLDFFLYSATLNISRVHIHQTDTGNGSSWQPFAFDNMGPAKVRPLYYGHAVMSQLIGKGKNTRIAEIDLTTLELPAYAGLASSYVIYRGDSIYGLTFINLKEADAGTKNRGSLFFNTNVGRELAGRTITVLKLSAPGANSLTGVTWAGTSYQLSPDGSATKVTNDSSSIVVASDGSISVEVADSQAVVVVLRPENGGGASLVPVPSISLAQNSAPVAYTSKDIYTPENTPTSITTAFARATNVVAGVAVVSGAVPSIASVTGTPARTGNVRLATSSSSPLPSGNVDNSAAGGIVTVAASTVTFVPTTPSTASRSASSPLSSFRSDILFHTVLGLSMIMFAMVCV